jgi:uncharacterized protein YecE (DUF72 family)
MAEVRIGTSGWSYPHWKGAFYPEGLRVKDQLGWYAGRFSTVEINGSFYRLPTEASVAAWRAAAPEGFLYAWKASRFITHNKRLKDAGDSIDLVFDRMAPLGDALGPALFQLTPLLKADLPRLDAFLHQLPKRRRIVIEFRHPSWFADDVFDLLKARDVAFCVSDHEDAPSPWEATARFAYVRGHGPKGDYTGSYEDAVLDEWAEQIMAWRDEGRDVYAYFDNDVGAAAPKDAQRLIERIG